MVPLKLSITNHCELLSLLLFRMIGQQCNLVVNLLWPRAHYATCVYALQRAPHDNILATSKLDEWKYLRRLLSPAFTPDNIRKVSCLPVMHTMTACVCLERTTALDDQ